MKTLLKRFAGVALAAWLAFFAAMATPAFAASNQEAESLMIRGDEYKNKGDYDKAIECYHQAITLKPDYVEPYFNRAVALEIGRHLLTNFVHFSGSPDRQRYALPRCP